MVLKDLVQNWNYISNEIFTTKSNKKKPH